jgi:hypothetical protein
LVLLDGYKFARTLLTASLSRSAYKYHSKGASLFKSGLSYRDVYCSPMDRIGSCVGFIHHAVTVFGDDLCQGRTDSIASDRTIQTMYFSACAGSGRGESGPGLNSNTAGRLFLFDQDQTAQLGEGAQPFRLLQPTSASLLERQAWSQG